LFPKITFGRQFCAAKVDFTHGKKKECRMLTLNLSDYYLAGILGMAASLQVQIPENQDRQ
jgi:hypothetical protein